MGAHSIVYPFITGPIVHINQFPGRLSKFRWPKARRYGYSFLRTKGNMLLMTLDRNAGTRGTFVSQWGGVQGLRCFIEQYALRSTVLSSVNKSI
jgi:hypothetical protein